MNLNQHETEKGAMMNQGTRNQLEAKLKEMLDHLDQAKANKRKPVTQSGTGNIIRRRAGEKEKRFSICRKPGSCTAVG